jgi:toxin CcdB
VQADWVNTGSRVVVPLIPAQVYGPPVSRLNPLFDIDGVSHVLATGDIAAIDSNELKRAVHDFSHHRQTIVAALDFLFQGY